jgi:hypothetical protein
LKGLKNKSTSGAWNQRITHTRLFERLFFLARGETISASATCWTDSEKLYDERSWGYRTMVSSSVIVQHLAQPRLLDNVWCSTDGKFCNIHHTFQTWYLKLQFFWAFLISLLQALGVDIFAKGLPVLVSHGYRCLSVEMEFVLKRSVHVCTKFCVLH